MIEVGYNAYTTIEYVNENLLEFDSATLWNALDESDKEKYLKYATRLFDTYGWIGNKVESVTQNLEFPRLYSTYFTDYRFVNDLTTEVKEYMYLNESKINNDVKISVVRIIENLLEQVSNKSLVNLQKVGVESFDAGSLSFTFSGISIDFVTEILQDTKIWFLTLTYWSSSTTRKERA